MNSPLNLPTLAIGTLGGTVSMTAASPAAGVTPTLDAAQLAASVPGLGELASLRTRSLRAVASGSLSFADLLDSLTWAEGEIAAGAQGVVITQGTDTLEESAFFLDLLWRHAQPLVLTGAMRAPQQAGADGPANLLAAARVALAAASRERGVLVVMNDAIHEARRVRKQHALSTDAFASPLVGAAGQLVEGKACYSRPPSPRVCLPRPAAGELPKVALVETTLGADDGLLQLIEAGNFQGLVVSAFGAGHVPVAWVEPLARLAGRMPVLIATRTGAGHTARHTYGYPGSEMDLLQRGCLMAGWLCPRKCRLLLALAVAAGAGREQIGEDIARL